MYVRLEDHALGLGREAEVLLALITNRSWWELGTGARENRPQLGAITSPRASLNSKIGTVASLFSPSLVRDVIDGREPA